MADVGYEQGSFTILTTDVGDGIRDPHNRMPIILDERGVPAWLRCEPPSPAADIATAIRSTRRITWSRWLAEEGVRQSQRFCFGGPLPSAGALKLEAARFDRPEKSQNECPILFPAG